jgi:hypothetical protein
MEIINEYKDSPKNLKKLYTKATGKPPVYQSPEDMMTMIKQYVKNGCKVRNHVIGRKPNERTIELKVLTLMGIVLHLGFTSRKQMYNFSQSHADYFEPISYAKTLITQYYEEKMQEGVSPTAMIFMLHNLDGLAMNVQQDTGDASRPAPQIIFTKAVDTKIRKMNGG